MIPGSRVRCYAGGLLLVLAACSAPPSDPEKAASGRAAGARGGGFRFVDVAREAGLTRVLHAGRPGKDHLLDSAGTGAAWIDYDRDGDLDAYLVNAWKLSGGEVVEKGRNALYRNRGDGTFEDVTDAAGVDGAGAWGSGVAVADYDDDGWPDILVTNFGSNALYRNRGDGTFEDVARRAGVDAPGWNTGAAFFDADRDGALDLYIAAYFDATLEEVLATRRTLAWKGVEKVAPGPFGYTGSPDHFFLSNGDGTFRDATAESGMVDLAKGYGFGVRAADFDSDGDLDLYVANDSDANYLYRNEGGGRFTETGLWSGAAFDRNGAAQAGMGVALGDVNRDLVFDLFVTNFSEDFSTLYVGEDRGFFRDDSDGSGIGSASYLPLSWGTVLADLDGDGDDDLVIANGHIYPQVDDHPEFGQTYGQRNQLMENLGDGRFVEASDRAGPGFALERSSRGLAAADYDNDGDVDLLITALDEPPVLLRNDSPSGTWLTIACTVPPGQGGVIGTSIEVTSGERRIRRDIASGSSFLSVNDPRAHFGLGVAETVDEVRVRWPDGTTTVETDVGTNRILTVEKKPAP